MDVIVEEENSGYDESNLNGLQYNKNKMIGERPVPASTN